MNTLETLTDAFTELERRADAAVLQTGVPPLRHHSRVPLVAAAVVTTLAVAGGAALLAHGSGPGSHAGGAGPTEPPNSQPAMTTTPATPVFHIPQTADELADRFRAVLGNLATFTVTDSGAPVTVTVPTTTITMPPTPAGSEPRIASTPIPIPNAGTPNGAAIVGTLTSNGVTGGYDIQILQNQPGSKAMCDDPDRSHCAHSTPADGGSLAVGHEALPTGGAGGVTYEVDLIRADGVEFLMHVSNERNPKGDSAVLAPQPPLTTDQMVAIVSSDRW